MVIGYHSNSQFLWPLSPAATPSPKRRRTWQIQTHVHSFLCPPNSKHVCTLPFPNRKGGTWYTLLSLFTSHFLWSNFKTPPHNESLSLNTQPILLVKKSAPKNLNQATRSTTRSYSKTTALSLCTIHTSTLISAHLLNYQPFFIK